jgi:hypothetical protein
MTAARCIRAFTAPCSKGQGRTEVQVAIDANGVPYVWTREPGQRPTLVRGVRALEQLVEGLERTLRVVRGTRPASEHQLTLATVTAGTETP